MLHNFVCHPQLLVFCIYICWPVLAPSCVSCSLSLLLAISCYAGDDVYHSDTIYSFHHNSAAKCHRVVYCGNIHVPQSKQFKTLACLILPSTVIFSPRLHFILVTGNVMVGGLPQLSHDVLVHIFSFIIPKAYLLNTHRFEVSTHLHTSRSPPPEHFIAFSQVCRHWRQVALATPTLWNAPLWDHLSLGALMLERASTALLTVIWPPIEGPNGRFVLNNSRGGQRPPQAAKLIAPLDGHVSRISELDLVGGGDDFEVTLNYVLGLCRRCGILTVTRDLNQIQIGLECGRTSMKNLFSRQCIPQAESIYRKGEGSQSSVPLYSSSD
jgi:hypothetical protein